MKGIDSSSPEPVAAPMSAAIAASAALSRPWPRAARSAMGLPLSATMTLSRSMNSSRPETMPPLPSAAGSAPAPEFAAESSMGWYRAERASCAATPFTAASATGTHSSRLGVGSATEGTLWAAAWNRPTRWAMVLKKLAAAIHARFPRVLGDHLREHPAFLRGRLRQRLVEDAGVRSGKVLPGQQRVDVRERAAVDGGAGHVVGGEAGGDGADGRQEPGERAAVPLRGDAGRAVRLQA